MKHYNTDGPYIVWVDYGCEGWAPISYDTLKEALEAHKTQVDWVTTKKVNYKILEVLEE